MKPKLELSEALRLFGNQHIRSFQPRVSIKINVKELVLNFTKDYSNRMHETSGILIRQFIFLHPVNLRFCFFIISLMSNIFAHGMRDFLPSDVRKRNYVINIKKFTKATVSEPSPGAAGEHRKR